MDKAYLDKSHMVSIWDSGIEYANFVYDNPSLSTTIYGFDHSNNKNSNTGDDASKYETKTGTKNSKQEKGKDGKKDKAAKEKDKGVRKDEGIEAPSWEEFTKKTTFHGVKYVFDQKPMRMRR